ncbi:MAG TPA: 3'-5' exonuclease [Patescibacteria group bacterium]|nr:3'-5' exonuclease [Patescibacteria group bacterium]
MRKLFFDCETGGLDPTIHSLLTAYFGVYNDDLELIDELYLQLKPEDVSTICVTPEAMQVTGINLEDHLNDPQTITYKEGAVKLVALLEKHKIPKKRRHYRPCGQNIDFDIPFVKNQLLDGEIWSKYVHHNSLDTLRILTFFQEAGILPKELGKLESMVEYFNIPMGQAHNAKEDIRMTVDVYKAFLALMKSKKHEMGITSGSSLLEIVEE